MTDPRVLVVEDHSSVRTLLRVLLESEGYRVMEAGDGDEALVMASEAKPDLIVLDLMMPNLDGEKVIEQLKDSQHTMNIPIVVVTAREESLETVGKVIGPENTFRKPFDEKRLLDRVKALAGPGTQRSKAVREGPEL